MSVINPITGRKITRGGRVYKSLVAAGHFMEDHMLPFKTKSSRRRKETKNEAYNWNVKYHVPPERSPSSSTIERAFANFSWRAPPPSSSSDDESFYTPPTSPRNRRRQYTPPGNPRFVSTPKPQRRKKSVYYTPPSSPIDGRVKPHTQQQKKHNSEAQQRRSLQAQLPFFPFRHSDTWRDGDDYYRLPPIQQQNTDLNKRRTDKGFGKELSSIAFDMSRRNIDLHDLQPEKFKKRAPHRLPPMRR